MKKKIKWWKVYKEIIMESQLYIKERYLLFNLYNYMNS